MMSVTPIIPSLLFIFLFIYQSAVVTPSDQLSAYDILQSYNFPVGILPKGVTNYDLNRETGQFHAYLNGSCSFSLEGSYQLRYKSKISGYISENKLTSLSGVSVKILFLWLNIVEVSRKGDDMYFSVGIASASFSMDNFYECPQCGCGLDCVNSRVMEHMPPMLVHGENLQIATGALQLFILENVSAAMPQLDYNSQAACIWKPDFSY